MGDNGLVGLVVGGGEAEGFLADSPVVWGHFLILRFTDDSLSSNDLDGQATTDYDSGRLAKEITC